MLDPFQPNVNSGSINFLRQASADQNAILEKVTEFVSKEVNLTSFEVPSCLLRFVRMTHPELWKQLGNREVVEVLKIWWLLSLILYSIRQVFTFDAPVKEFLPAKEILRLNMSFVDFGRLWMNFCIRVRFEWRGRSDVIIIWKLMSRCWALEVRKLPSFRSLRMRQTSKYC
jgi:hypothetical protein